MWSNTSITSYWAEWAILFVFSESVPQYYSNIKLYTLSVILCMIVIELKYSWLEYLPINGNMILYLYYQLNHAQLLVY